MPSKDVIDRLRLAQELTAIIDQLSEPLAETLSKHLAPQLRGDEAMPDLELTRRLMGRLVTSQLQDLLTEEEVRELAFLEQAEEDDA